MIPSKSKIRIIAEYLNTQWHIPKSSAGEKSIFKSFKSRNLVALSLPNLIYFFSLR